MSGFSIKQGNLSPNVRAQLVYSDGTLVNLSAATTVTFQMRSKVSLVVAISAVASVIDAAKGIVEYAWQAGDTDDVDEYDTEWDVQWADGEIQTFPSKGFGTVEVTERIV